MSDDWISRTLYLSRFCSEEYDDGAAAKELDGRVRELISRYNELKEAASAFLQCDDPDGFILKHGDQYERLMVALSDGKTGGTV